MVLWVNEYLMTSNLICFFNSVKLCPLVILLYIISEKNILRVKRRSRECLERSCWQTSKTGHGCPLMRISLCHRCCLSAINYIHMFVACLYISEWFLWLYQLSLTHSVRLRIREWWCCVIDVFHLPHRTSYCFRAYCGPLSVRISSGGPRFDDFLYVYGCYPIIQTSNTALQVSSTQFNRHSTVNKHQRRIPIVSSPWHEQQNMTFFSSSRMQARHTP